MRLSKPRFSLASNALAVWFFSLFAVAACLAPYVQLKAPIYAYIALWVACVATLILMWKPEFSASNPIKIFFLLILWSVVPSIIRDKIALDTTAFMTICISLYAVFSTKDLIFTERVAGKNYAMLCGLFLLFYVPETNSTIIGENYANFFTTVIAYSAMFAWSGKIRWWHFGVAIALGGYVGTRALVVASLASYLAWNIWLIKNRPIVKYMSALFLVVLLVAIPIVYAYYIENRGVIDMVSIEFTGKRLESGRIDIWTEIWSGMTYKQVLIGAGAPLTTSYHGIDGISAHSLYFALLYQYGFVGLLLGVLVLWMTFFNLRRKNLTFSAIMVAFFSVREMFEVSLFMNSLPVAIIFWSLFASGFLERSLLHGRKAKS
tara:strand:- start:202 stop:1329 length:1128 start_codon:yes stop_codon:yes gene_type:complete